MLKLLIENRYSKRFIVKDIPAVLISKIDTCIRKNKNVNDYLESIGINNKNFLEHLKKNFVVSNIDKKTLCLQFNNNAKIKDFKLDTIIRTINFGNRKLRATNIFSDAFNYVKSNINNIYMLSLMKGGIV